MALIERFVEGEDMSRADDFFPTHALWIDVTSPGEIDPVEFDKFAERVNPYTTPDRNGSYRKLKYLAWAGETTTPANIRMVIFYPGFEHLNYDQRMKNNGVTDPLKSAGMVSLYMRESGLVVKREIWGESLGLAQQRILTIQDSSAYKMDAMRPHLEPPFSFRR